MRFIKNSILALLMLLLLLPQPAVAQEITPTLYCLGNCPGEPTATLPPASVTPSVSFPPVESPVPSNTQPPSEPNPTVNPCLSEGSSEIQHNKKKKKHKKSKGGFLGKFFEFILKIFELLIHMIGGKPPTTPQPTPTPSIEPSITPEVTPTVDPCITPTEVVEQPSVTPEVPTPSGTALTPTISSSLSCLSPVWSSSDPNGMNQIDGYFLHNNMWNASSYPDTKQTIFACSSSNWYVQATANDAGDGAVKTYPNVHKDYDAVPISSLNTITTSYSHVAPTAGNWNFAYDIWINGIGNGNGNIELMIWTQALGKQASAVKTYPRVGTVTLSGITYNVYKNNTYIVFEMSPYKSSSTINLKEIFSYSVSKGLIPANATLHQVDYGVEVVSTNGTQSTFKFNNFTLTAN